MKILLISNTPLIPTGFSKVVDYIAMHLSKKHKIYFQGKNMFHIPLHFHNYLLLQGGRTEIGIHPLQSSTAQLTRMYINKIKPDIILTLEDARSLSYMPKLLEEIKYEGKWIFYYPLDMEFEAPWHKEYVKNPDIVVCMSDFAHQIVKKWQTKKLKKIYHGYNAKLFRPRKRDETLYKGFKLDKYKHVIGYVSNNQFRKMTYLTLLAFKELKKKLKDICLLMHTPMVNPGIGWPLGRPGFSEVYDIKDVIFNPIADF